MRQTGNQRILPTTCLSDGDIIMSFCAQNPPGSNPVFKITTVLILWFPAFSYKPKTQTKTAIVLSKEGRVFLLTLKSDVVEKELVAKGKINKILPCHKEV